MTARNAFWAVPSAQSGMKDKIVVYYIPLRRKKDDSFYGAFALALNISYIDDKLRKHLPYGKQHSEMLIVSQNNDIISSYPVSYKNFASYRMLADTIKNHTTDIQYDSIQGRKIFNYDGVEYFQYQRKLHSAPWTIITGCTSQAVYAEANNVERVILITSLVGMILMLVLCTVVSLQIYRTHKKKNAAEHELLMASRVQMSMLRNPHYEMGEEIIHHTSKIINSPEWVPMSANMAVGIMHDYPYTSERITLHEGDSILLYTDGVTEAETRKKLLLGEERLLELISTEEFRQLNPEGMVNAIYAAVKNFTNNIEANDDITLLVVEL